MDYIALISQVGFPSFMLYLLIKEVVVPLVKKPEKDKTEFNGKAILEELVKMNGNHLTHVEQAIREQTKLFQEDHQKNYELMVRVSEGINTLKERGKS